MRTNATQSAARAPIVAREAPPRATASVYPPPFATTVAGRVKRPLGNLFGLTRFGVNLTSLEPGGRSSLRHAHSLQDEFVYVLEGHPTLITDDGEVELAPGMCVGFPHGTGNAHHLVNRSAGHVAFLEVGDRTAGDHVTYPDDDLVAVGSDGGWRFTRKDGTPY